jgi:hypothetical protein
MLKKLLIISMGLIMMCGCATGKFNYTKPKYSNVPYKNSKMVLKNKNEVWKSVIKGLATSFFVINNLDKESGFVNISYAGSPENYVNCGIIKSMGTLYGRKYNYLFPAQKRQMTYLAYDEGIKCILSIDRTMNLEGRINLIIEEVGSNETLVTVNIKYILTKKTRGQVKQSINPFYPVKRYNIFNTTETCSFNTNQTGKFDSGITTCKSTNELEKNILELIN